MSFDIVVPCLELFFKTSCVETLTLTIEIEIATEVGRLDVETPSERAWQWLARTNQ